MLTSEERHDITAGALVAFIVGAFSLLFCAGCGKPAPAADPPIKYVLPVKECGNPNCTCESCDGNCECGNRPGPSKAEIEEMKQRLADREQLLEAMKASLASLKKEAEKKSVVAKSSPTFVNGEWQCTHNGKRLAWRAVRCFGPNVPCEMGWVEVRAEPRVVGATPARAPRQSAPACASGNCGNSGNFQRFQPRGRMGWRRW